MITPFLRLFEIEILHTDSLLYQRKVSDIFEKRLYSYNL